MSDTDSLDGGSPLNLVLSSLIPQSTLPTMNNVSFDTAAIPTILPVVEYEATIKKPRARKRYAKGDRKNKSLSGQLVTAPLTIAAAIDAVPKPQALIPDATRRSLEVLLGYVFDNPDFLWEALQARGSGVYRLGDRIIDDGNKKMALLGDALLKVVVLDEWVDTGAARRAGHEVATALGRNRHLDSCGRKAGLEAFINRNPQLCLPGREAPVSVKLMSATIEALVAAVYLDSGKDLKIVYTAMRGLGLYEYAARVA